MHYAKLTNICCALLLSSSLGAQDLDSLEWKKKRQPHSPRDISTFVSKVEGQAVKAFKGVVHMPYSVEQIVRLLKDHQRLPQWVFQNQSVQENLIPQSKAFVMQFKGVWPISNRDVLVDYQYTQNEQSGGTRLHAWNAPDIYPKQRKYVRIPLLNNRWHIIPAQQGWSEVQFSTLIDVGGSIPAWIANIVANDAPRRTLSGMRKMLDSGNYGAPTATIQ